MCEIEDIAVILSPIADKPQLLAYLSFRVGPVTVKDVKVILSNDGRNVIVFPERPLLRDCTRCTSRCPVRHKFCHNCGRVLPESSRVRGLGKSIVQPAEERLRAGLSMALLRAYCEAYSGHVATRSVA